MEIGDLEIEIGDRRFGDRRSEIGDLEIKIGDWRFGDRRSEIGDLEIGDLVIS